MKNNGVTKTVRLYFVCFTVSITVFMVVNLTSYGEVFKHIFAGDYYPDYFMDFFNSIRDAGTLDVYSKRIIYPPLANMFFYFCSKFINPNLVATDFENRNLLQTDYSCLFIYLSFAFAVIIFFIFIVSKYVYKQGYSNYTVLLPVILTCSYPVLYCFQRGNIALLTLAFTLFFVVYRNSQNGFLRELSFILLAIAAGLKIYPALFGLLLIFDKKYKSAVRLIIYGVLAFILPFFFYDGFESIRQLFNNLTVFAEKSNNSVELGFVSIDFFAYCADEFLGVSYALVYRVLFVVTYSASAFILFSSNEEWKRLWAIAFMIMNYTSTARSYILVLALIPFLFWIFKREKRRIDWVYFIGFMLIMLIITPIYYCRLDDILNIAGNLLGNPIERVGTKFFVRLNLLVSPFALSGMTLFMFVDNVICLVKRKKNRL